MVRANSFSSICSMYIAEHVSQSILKHPEGKVGARMGSTCLEVKAQEQSDGVMPLHSAISPSPIDKMKVWRSKQRSTALPKHFPAVYPKFKNPTVRQYPIFGRASEKDAGQIGLLIALLPTHFETVNGVHEGKEPARWDTVKGVCCGQMIDDFRSSLGRINFSDISPISLHPKKNPVTDESEEQVKSPAHAAVAPDPGI